MLCGWGGNLVDSRSMTGHTDVTKQYNLVRVKGMMMLCGWGGNLVESRSMTV